MSFKEQLVKIKDNWLIILIVFLAFIFMMGGGILNPGASFSSQMMGGSYDMAYSERAYAPNAMYEEDFAPEIEERKIIKTASMTNEVQRGTFHDNQDKLKNIIKSSKSILLSENVNKNGVDRKAYYSGYYQIKVDTAIYDSVISQLKTIGEVQSFNENSADVTGSYTNLEIEIKTEEARLEKYRDLYQSNARLEDKLTLTDRIFNQERTIEYYKERLENMDNKIEYSTVNFRLNEKRSDYANIALVKFSELIKTTVQSFNTLLYFIFGILPWIVLAGIVYIIYRFIKR